MNYHRFIAIFILLGPFWAQGSQEDCNIQNHPANQHSDLIQAATLIGEENRENESEFSESTQTPLDRVQAAFSATGILTCGGFEQTAQITGKTNVITTAGHMFFDENCNLTPAADVEQCYFKKSGKPDEKLFYLDAASLKTGKCIPDGHFEDWATVKLDEPVEGAEPYRIPDRPVRLKVGDTILNASAFDANFKDGNQDSVNLNVCSITEVVPDQFTALRTSCDTGGGASGGAQFLLGSSGISLEPDKLILYAINVAESRVAGQYNVSVPLAPKFLDAINANMR